MTIAVVRSQDKLSTVKSDLLAVATWCLMVSVKFMLYTGPYALVSSVKDGQMSFKQQLL